MLIGKEKMISSCKNTVIYNPREGQIKERKKLYISLKSMH